MYYFDGSKANTAILSADFVYYYRKKSECNEFKETDSGAKDSYWYSSSDEVNSIEYCLVFIFVFLKIALFENLLYRYFPLKIIET